MNVRILFYCLLLISTFVSAQDQCEINDMQWLTPTPTVIVYPFGGGWITGVPDPVNQILPTDPKGVYERFFTPDPGVTRIDAVRVGMGWLTDEDDDMRFQVIVYDDDGFGNPGAVVGGTGNISPTTIGVPAQGFYNEFWLDLPSNPIPTTGSYHVGVEIFPGDQEDTLVVITSCLGPADCPVPEGENDASNHIFTTGFGFENLLTVYGADFDIGIVPKHGTPASVNGFVWLDLNGNGIYDPDPPTNESMLNDLSLYLDLNTNGIKDPEEPSTVTNQGAYTFFCLDAGDYSLVIDEPSIPNGIRLNTGNNPTPITLASDENLENVNFGFVEVFDLAITDVSLFEGDVGSTGFDFTVSLTQASSDQVEVDYTTIDGSAIAVEDYTPTADTLIFSPGEVAKTISVDVWGDGTVEIDENFSIFLSNPVNATIADNTGIGTILDDDDLIFADGFEANQNNVIANIREI
ncbi:MAG: Calx-beta domain-containing protein [Marinicella sp.]